MPHPLWGGARPDSGQGHAPGYHGGDAAHRGEAAGHRDGSSQRPDGRAGGGAASGASPSRDVVAPLIPRSPSGRDGAPIVILPGVALRGIRCRAVAQPEHQVGGSGQHGGTSRHTDDRFAPSSPPRSERPRSRGMTRGMTRLPTPMLQACDGVASLVVAGTRSAGPGPTDATASAREPWSPKYRIRRRR